MALGGALRGAPFSEESGSCHRPGSSLVAVAWATGGAEAAGLRVDHMPTCPGGGRARPSLLGGVGRRVMQDLAGSSGISPELRVRGGSCSLGGHLPLHPTLFTVLASYACCLSLYYSIYMSDQASYCDMIEA